MCPLYTVGSVDRPSANAVGKAIANVTIDGVVADRHDVKIVNDDLIPVDVLVGRTWLELPHFNYYKQENEIVFETNCHLEGRVLTDDVSSEDPQVLTVECNARLTPSELITDDEVTLGSELDPTSRRSLMTLINRYRDAFAKSIGELGCTNVLKMNITENYRKFNTC